MSDFAKNRRGGPLTVLGLVMVTWVGGRAVMWENPFPAGDLLHKSTTLLAEGEQLEIKLPDFDDVAEAGAAAASGTAAAIDAVDIGTVGSETMIALESSVEGLAASTRVAAIDAAEHVSEQVAEVAPATTPDAADLFSGTMGAAAGHQMLLMAAMSNLPMPRVVEEVLAERARANPSASSQGVVRFELPRPNGEPAGASSLPESGAPSIIISDIRKTGDASAGGQAVVRFELPRPTRAAAPGTMRASVSSAMSVYTPSETPEDLFSSAQYAPPPDFTTERTPSGKSSRDLPKYERRTAQRSIVSGAPKADRWSLDAWAFAREGSNALPVSQGSVPIYGASQLGAVLRYELAPDSQFRPRAYVRGYHALVDNGESEIAVGGSVRPIPGVPLRAHVETRAIERPLGDSEIRGSAFVTTEIPQIALPFGTKAEIYGQGGYVSGDDAVWFADGQVQVTREVIDFNLESPSYGKISVGAGAWAGVQEPAGGNNNTPDTIYRVDVGPTIRMDFTIGKQPARISVDWRERVAGDAMPSSGVAATISTRF